MSMSLAGASARTGEVIEVNQNYQILATDEADHEERSREARLSEAMQNVKVKRLQQKDVKIENYF